MAPSFIPLLVLPAFLLGFALIWTGVVYLISLLSGWRRLARRYRYQGPPRPDARSGSGRIGVANYKGALRVAFDDRGLYLGVNPFFRAGHPTLFIPWTDISGAQRGKALLFQTMKLEVKDGPRIVLYGDWDGLAGAWERR
jgi:hypothetical protein